MALQALKNSQQIQSYIKLFTPVDTWWILTLTQIDQWSIDMVWSMTIPCHLYGMTGFEKVTTKLPEYGSGPLMQGLALMIAQTAYAYALCISIMHYSDMLM